VYSGKPCRNGHEGTRYVNDRRCVACRTEEWEKRRALRAEYAKEWAAKNPDKKKANFANWRAKNVERDRFNSTDWQQNNRPKAIAAIAKRKAALLQRTPRWANLVEIQKFDDEAAMMTLRTGVPHEVDHIYPLQGKTVSGLHVAENLRVIPARENRRKGNRIN